LIVVILILFVLAFSLFVCIIVLILTLAFAVLSDVVSYYIDSARTCGGGAAVMPRPRRSRSGTCRSIGERLMRDSGH
jgi:hypothetical protein